MKTRILFHLETFNFKERAEMGGFCHVKIRWIVLLKYFIQENVWIPFKTKHNLYNGYLKKNKYKKLLHLLIINYLKILRHDFWEPTIEQEDKVFVDEISTNWVFPFFLLSSHRLHLHMRE